MPRKRQRATLWQKCPRRFARRPEPRPGRTDPFLELDYFQVNFLDALCTEPSPRAAMNKANLHPCHLIDWMDHPAFFTALTLTLYRRFGHARGGQRLTVVYRFFVSSPLPHVCYVRDRCHASFFPELEVYE
jgi:hypothetical protein